MTNRSFVAGLVVCVALMIILGGSLFLLNHGHSRPEGVAENWLTAVGDTSRKGLEADATRRADKIGPLELADRRLVSSDTDNKAAFKDLEVGKAVRVDAAAAEKVKVAFRVHARRGTDTVEVDGVMSLDKSTGDWHVTAVDLVNSATTQGLPAAQVLAGIPKLPSDGGPPPASAPTSLWIGALIGSAIVGVVTTALVKVAGGGATVAPATA